MKSVYSQDVALDFEGVGAILLDGSLVSVPIEAAFEFGFKSNFAVIVLVGNALLICCL